MTTDNFSFDIGGGTSLATLNVSNNLVVGGTAGIGGTPAAGRNLVVAKNITGSTTSRGITSIGQIQSDVTTTASYFATSTSTPDTAFTLGTLQHYTAIQGTIGASSVVTNQYGYYADSTMTGATNNYGFYGGIALGAGRWNFYAAGTANNYFAGNLSVGTLTSAEQLTVSANVRAAIIYGNRASAANVTTGGLGVSIDGILQAQIISPASSAMGFVTAGTEKMRLFSGGGFSVGATTTDPGAGYISDIIGNVRSVPQNAQTSSYVLVAGDNGKHISITTGGVTINSGIHSVGDTITIFNNSSSSQTITQGTSVTLRQSATTNTGNRTLAGYGICTILCVAANTFVITGSGLT
jgi:hypothetical protein